MGPFRRVRNGFAIRETKGRMIPIDRVIIEMSRVAGKRRRPKSKAVRSSSVKADRNVDICLRKRDSSASCGAWFWENSLGEGEENFDLSSGSAANIGGPCIRMWEAIENEAAPRTPLCLQLRTVDVGGVICLTLGDCPLALGSSPLALGVICLTFGNWPLALGS